MCFLFVVCEQTKSLQKCEADMLEGKWCIYRKDIFLVSWEWNTINYVEKGQKCPNKELFLVRIFLYSNWIRRDTVQIKSYFWSVFSCIWTKYGEILSKCGVISGLYFPVFFMYSCILRIYPYSVRIQQNADQK